MLFSFLKFYLSQIIFLSVLVFVSYYGGLKGLHYIDIYPRSFDIFRFFVFLGLALVVSLVVFLRISRFIELNIQLFIFVFFLPNVAFFVGGGGNNLYFLICLIVLFFFIFTIFFFLRFFQEIPNLKRNDSFGLASLWILLLCSCTFIFINFDYFSLTYDFQNIYSNREIISKNQFPGFEYVHMMLSKAILPILLMTYIFARNVFKSLCCFGVYIVLFLLKKSK